MRLKLFYCVVIAVGILATATPSLEDVLSLYTSSTFTCTGAADSLSWNVNGVGADHFSSYGIITQQSESLGDGLLQRNLTVHAREEHNNSHLQCIAFTGLQGVVVKEVNITIQGLLSSPGSVHTVNGSSSILLSWTAPFTLNITDVDADITHYTVYITHLNTGRMGEENVTETEFIFTGLPGEGTPVPCSTYQFRVSAWNVVGEGNRSGPVYGHFIPEINNTLQVTVSKDGHLQVECFFQVNCLADFYMVHINGTDIDQTKRVDEPSSTENGMMINISHYFPELGDDDHFILTLLAENKMLTARDAEFSTFDIQDADMEVNGNTAIVTCYIAVGSRARGCLVKFVASSGSSAQNTSVMGMGSENVATATMTLPSGTYTTILVHDIESDGSNSSNPAVTLNEPITIEEPSSVTTPVPTMLTNTESTSSPGTSKSQQSVIIGAIISAAFVIIMILIGISAVVICVKFRQQNLNKVDTVKSNVYVESKPTTQTDGAHRPPQGYESVPLRSDSSSSDSSSGSSPSSQSTDVDGITAGGHQDQVTSPEDYERVNLQQPKPVARFNAPQGTQGLTYAALGPARQPAPVRHDQESMPYTQIDFRAMAAKAVHQKSRLSPPVQPDSVQNRDSLTD